jgi:hypothetical protein
MARTRRQVGMLLWVLACLITVPVWAGGQSSAEGDLDRDLRRIDPGEHIKALSSWPSRYTGYPGCKAAGEYIAAKFRAIGLASVEETPFQVVVPIVPDDERWGKKNPEGSPRQRPEHEADLTVGQRQIPLYCLQPNYVRASMTDEEGISGRLVWAGAGYMSDFSGRDVADSIILMDFNSMSRWMDAAKLGARAIVFVEPTNAFRPDAEQKYSDLPIPLPRYYVRRAELPALAGAVTGKGAEQFTAESAVETLSKLGSDEMAGIQANLKAQMRWEEATVMRISGEIPGVDPQLSEQPVVVFAYYDSTSVVPALSPGAESSCGVATLLEVAEFLANHPPRRKVKFIAAPGHYEALAGVRNYAFQTIYPRREGADKAAKQGTGEPYFFIGLDLSSRSDNLGSFYKGNFYDQLATEEVELQRSYSELSSLLSDWGGQLGLKGGPAPGVVYQSGIVPQQGRDWRSLLSDLMAFDSEVISECGYPGITLATTGDLRSSVNTPQDTYELMEPCLGNVRGQAIMCAALIKKMADVPVLPTDRAKLWEKREAGTLFGFAIEYSQAAYMPKVAVPNAVAAVSMLSPTVTSKAKCMTGVRTYECQISNLQGLFEIIGLVDLQQFRVDGFLLSPTNGAVTKVARSELAVATNRMSPVDWAERETDLRLNFFRCVSATLFDLTNPLNLRTMGQSTARRGESNGQLEYLVSFVGQESLSDPFSKPVAVFFTERDRNVKFLLASGAVGYEGLLLNMAEETGTERKKERTGIGFRLDKTENIIRLTALQVTKDMHALDGERLDRLSRSGIVKTMVHDLYDKAGNYLDAAERVLASHQYDMFYHNVRMAWGLEGRVYPDVRKTATDVVKGVIFYFALLLPFVLFAERLLINYVEIRRKLAAIAVLFALSYLVLRLVHPAFQLSRTPVIILDGFLMMVAGVVTIWYLLNKFGVVMERVRRKVDMIHRADVARASAAMAAFVLGISNMRKRKVRTGLTAATLILLTFTILSFTSFETVPDRMLVYSSPHKAPYVGVLLRGLGWGPLSEFVCYDMSDFFQVQGMKVAPRSWFVNRKKTEDMQLDIRRGDGSQGEAVANAILGLSPEEKYFSHINDSKYLEHEWFDRSMPDWPFVCILPTRMRENLRIEDSEIGKAWITVLGRSLRVVGTFKSDEMFRFQDLDGEEISPVDFVAQQYKQAAGGAAAAADQGGGALSATGQIDVETFVHRKSAKQEQEEQYIHMEPDRALVVPNELNLELGGTVRSMAVGPGMSTEADEALRPFRQVLQQLLSRVDLALYAGYSDSPDAPATVHRVATRSRLSMGGIKGLVVPIMIAALIVFNTMLGAVYERMSEIRTYASVGLAPMHIAALFFAESCVFAVMGAMLGYLLGQVISQGLKLVPSLMAGMSLNYSSVSAVWSAVLVVAVVLASTAYPARMAGKLSVPDETRKMLIPKPTTDVWEIWFPFTVSSKEALGVMSYLRDYFESNDEDAIGNFTADNIEFYAVMEEGTRRICLEADVWVAPLDMGVSQRAKIAAIPDPEEGDITYLFFTITRKSGEFQTWHRMNLGFLKDLRKQLLIWRLVTPDAKKRLTQEGATLIEDRTGAVA